MKIYTRTGDDGSTSLFGSGRVSKADSRVSAYGDVDETGAAIGVARASLPGDSALHRELMEIQHRLFDLGSELASPGRENSLSSVISAEDTALLEKSIDGMETSLPPLKTFIIAGGAGARLHLARTVCRRAERSVIRLASEAQVRKELIVYLNRLSDWLFVAARFANSETGAGDEPWLKKS